MGIDENVNSQFPVGYMQSNMNIYIYIWICLPKIQQLAPILHFWTNLYYREWVKTVKTPVPGWTQHKSIFILILGVVVDAFPTPKNRSFDSQMPLCRNIRTKKPDNFRSEKLPKPFFDRGKKTCQTQTSMVAITRKFTHISDSDFTKIIYSKIM